MHNPRLYKDRLNRNTDTANARTRARIATTTGKMGSIGYQDTGYRHHDPNVMPSLAPPLPRYAPEHVAEEDRYEVVIAGVRLGHDFMTVNAWRDKNNIID